MLLPDLLRHWHFRFREMVGYVIENIMELYIKHMINLPCKMLVKAELAALGLHCVSMEFGVVEIDGEITAHQNEVLKTNLQTMGFYLLDDKKSILIDRVKTVIIEMIHNSDQLPTINFSDHISKIIGYDYTYLSNIFSQATGTTIQHFIIVHKIERVKELLRLGELSLTDISLQLDYSSVGHLSAQFKKVAGFTPSSFKQLIRKRLNNPKTTFPVSQNP